MKIMIKPIILYGSEIWGCIQSCSSKYRNGYTFEKIFDKTEQDLIYTKYEIQF